MSWINLGEVSYVELMVGGSLALARPPVTASAHDT